MTKLTTILYIVRHGQSQHNVEKRLSGHSDSPLSPLGKKQAAQLAREFKDIHFDMVFSSDLERAHHTAKIATSEKNLTVKTTQIIREQYFGSYEGKYEHEYESDFLEELKIYRNLPDQKKLKYKIAQDMETDEESVTRFITFLREIAVENSGNTILVVCHGSIMMYFLIWIGFGTYRSIVNIKNTGYIKVETDGEVFTVKETRGVEIKK